MKIKIDFVTNSSTSCFVAWGIEIGNEELLNNEDFLKKVYEYLTTDGPVRELGDEGKELSFDEWQDIVDVDEIGEYIESLSLQTHSGYDYDYWYIGMNPNQMEDDETKKEFIEKIKNALKESGLGSYKIGYIEQAWYDG